MLPPATPQFRRRRGAPKRASSTTLPGPTSLTLVSAVYDSDALTLILTFDRPINAAGIIFEAVLVADAQFLHQYLIPNDWFGPDPNSVEFLLATTEPPTGSGAHLSVAEGNGIIALADGEPWMGCTNLLLPFP